MKRGEVIIGHINTPDGLLPCFMPSVAPAMYEYSKGSQKIQVSTNGELQGTIVSDPVSGLVIFETELSEFSFPLLVDSASYSAAYWIATTTPRPSR